MWLSGSEAGRSARLGAARLDGRAGRASRSKKGATFDGLGQPSGRPRPRIFSRIPEVGWSSFGLGTYRSVSLPFSSSPPLSTRLFLRARRDLALVWALVRVVSRAAPPARLLSPPYRARHAENRSRETIERRVGERSLNEFSDTTDCCSLALRFVGYKSLEISTCLSPTRSSNFGFLVLRYIERPKGVVRENAMQLCFFQSNSLIFQLTILRISNFLDFRYVNVERSLHRNVKHLNIEYLFTIFSEIYQNSNFGVLLLHYVVKGRRVIFRRKGRGRILESYVLILIIDQQYCRITDT